MQQIYISPEKRQQIFHDLRFFRHRTKMEFQKITKILGIKPDKVPKFITKKSS